MLRMRGPEPLCIPMLLHQQSVLPRYLKLLRPVLFLHQVSTRCYSRSALRANMSKSNKWYAVREGREAGIYSNWEAAREQVHGYSNNEHR